MKTQGPGAARWARQEFGTLRADARNVERVVLMAKQAAEQPSGRVTRATKDAAALQGAYDLLHNPRVPLEELAGARNRAAAKRCRGQRVAIVPVDTSSLTITDKDHTKGTGRIGTKKFKARGFNVITALLLVAGIVAGIGDQAWWTRPEHKRRTHRHKLPLEKKESGRWLQMLVGIAALLQQVVPECRPWFQIDRGGDVSALLLLAIKNHWLLTVRAQHDRLVVGSRARRLRAHLRALPVAGYTEQDVVARPGRKARRAKLAVRFAPALTFVARDRCHGGQTTMTLSVVHVREVQTTPRGEKPIEWFLLTTRRVRTLEDALRVVRAYLSRWPVEEFHNSWKSGVCNVEETQLRSPEAIQKWATILGSVATRALRLRDRSRVQPEAPAEEEFSQDEIDAVLLLRQPSGYRVGQRPALGDLTRWIAELGGYTGKSSGGPPGKSVIARGLLKIAPAAQALAALRAQSPPRPPRTAAQRLRAKK